MSIKVARMICEYQGISFRLETMVLCPACKVRTARIDIQGRSVECIRCHKKWSLSEFLRLCEEDWLDKHSEAYRSQSEKKGVNL